MKIQQLKKQIERLDRKISSRKFEMLNCYDQIIAKTLLFWSRPAVQLGSFLLLLLVLTNTKLRTKSYRLLVTISSLLMRMRLTSGLYYLVRYKLSGELL